MYVKVNFWDVEGSYRINVGLIDQQHEELLNGFQIFFQVVQSKEPEVKVGKSRDHGIHAGLCGIPFRR